MRRVGVLLVTKGLGRGGTERLLAGTVRHLDRERYRVEVAYLLPHKDAFVPEIEASGATVHCLHAPHPTSLGWVPRLRRLVREWDIALVHTHAPIPAIAARLVLNPRKPGAPALIHTEHNLWDRYRWPTRWANARTFHRNRAAIAVSEGVAASMRTAVPTEVVVHGIDTAAMHHGPAARQEARARLGIDPDRPVVGTVGNLTPKKDHSGLLEAFAKTRAEHPEAVLVLVGLGPLEETLRQHARQLGLLGGLGAADAVRFTGSRDDVFELLPGFDVFVLGSRFEGLPIALLEAMASGVAPVATRVGGIPEVITDGDDGQLVPPGDPMALATAITGLLSDDATRQRLAQGAHQRAADFDLAAAVRRIERIYDRALDRDRAPEPGGAGAC